MEEERTCYICEDDVPNEAPQKVCACNNRYLHASCQRRLMLSMPSSHSMACTVCNSAFTNLRVSTTTPWYACTSSGVLVTRLVIFSTLLASFPFTNSRGV